MKDLKIHNMASLNPLSEATVKPSQCVIMAPVNLHMLLITRQYLCVAACKHFE